MIYYILNGFNIINIASKYSKFQNNRLDKKDLFIYFYHRI